MTPCHGVRAALCPIYVLPQGQRIERKEIGHIQICPAEKCGKVIGEPIRYRGTGGFSDEEWQILFKARQGRPPFYFVQTASGLEPEDTADQRFTVGVSPIVKEDKKAAPQNFPLTGPEKAAGAALEESEWINGE